MITTDNKSINFVKKEDLTGSYQGMRYRMHRIEEEFETAIWPEPFCYEKMDKESMETKRFPLTVEGRDEAVAWLNQKYQEKEEGWKKAAASFYSVFKK